MKLFISLLITVIHAVDPVVYRISAGSQVGVDGMISDYNYSAMGAYPGAVPANVTITPLNGAMMIPVFYGNVYYLLYNLTTNLTDTLYLDYCDPLPNRDQGNISYTERGNPICPTTYECVITELAPDENYQNWPDLRCCLLNFTIIDRTDIPPIYSGATVEALSLDVEMTLNQPPPNVTTSFGRVDCADFIARSMNCQWARQLNTYQLQCLSWPVPCYSRGIGKFFGGFWEQNPIVQYTLPRENWTEAHWRGIASTLNNLTYYENGLLTDPLTPLVLDDYYWIPGLLELEQEQIVGAPPLVYSMDIIELQPYSWILGSFPPPPTLFGVDLTSNIFTDLSSCIFTYSANCAYYDWYNVSSYLFRSAAFTFILAVENPSLLYSVNISLPYPVYGMELTTPDGETCGKFMRPIAANEQVIFYCAKGTAPANSSYPLYVFAPSIILDVVGKGIAPPIEPYDSPYLELLTYFVFELNEYIALLGRLIMMFFAIAFNTLTPVRYFPNRINPDIANFATGGSVLFTVNYSSTASQATFLSAVENVTNNIRLYNVYPYNYALANYSAFRGFTTVPVNLSNPDHQDWLYAQWSTWYAPRQAGSESGQCETFTVGTTVYPDPAPRQYWFNGEPESPGYVIPPGTAEGGCHCNTSSPARTDPQFFCSKCTEGFGPQVMVEWSYVLQSNSVVEQVLNSSYPTFQLTDWTTEQFKLEFLCRFPMTPDPLEGALAAVAPCSGHGLLTYTETVSTIELTEYYVLPSNVWTFPLCTSLLIRNTTNTTWSELTLYLPDEVDPFTLLYNDTENIITVLEGSTIYFNGGVCLFTEDVGQPLDWEYPPYGTLQCETALDMFIGCVNPIIFREEGFVLNIGDVGRFNTWLGYYR